VLIENLRRLAARIVLSRDARRHALHPDCFGIGSRRHFGFLASVKVNFLHDLEQQYTRIRKLTIRLE
jgi:hypothetical protein